MDTKRARTLLVGGALGMLVAAIGLNCFGAAPFLVLRDALLVRPGEGSLESLRWSGYTALAGLLYGTSTAVAVGGLLAGCRQHRLASGAAAIAVVIGLAAAVAGAGIMYAAARQMAAFRVLAASETAPQMEDLVAIVAHTLTPVRVGLGAILVSAVLWVGLAGRRPHISQEGVVSDVSTRLAGWLCILTAAGFGLILGLVWFPTRQVLGILQAGGPVRPGELASSLSHTLLLSQLAGLLVLVHGVLLIAVAILGARSRRAMNATD